MPFPFVLALQEQPGTAEGKDRKEDGDEIHRERPVASGKSTAVQVEQEALNRYARLEQLGVLLALGCGKIRRRGPGNAVARRGLPGQRIAALERTGGRSYHEPAPARTYRVTHPSAGLVHQVNEYFGLIWDEADDLSRLARLSNPRVTVNTAGLTPEQTALANRLAQVIHRLSPETVAALHAVLDTTAHQSKPRLRRAAPSRTSGHADRTAR